MRGWQANKKRTCALPVVLGLCPKRKYPPLCGGIFICWAGEVSAECPGHDLQAGHRPAFPAQHGKVGGAGALPNPGRLSRSCPHPPASPPNKSPNQSRPWSVKAPWLFCWGRFRRNAPGMTCRRARAGISRTARKGGRSGGSQVVPAQTRAAYSWVGFPLGIVWYFQSIR